MFFSFFAVVCLFVIDANKCFQCFTFVCVKRACKCVHFPQYKNNNNKNENNTLMMMMMMMKETGDDSYNVAGYKRDQMFMLHT